MTRVAALALVLFAACENPALSVRFRLTGGEAQQCVGDNGSITTSCQDVTMLCDAYVSIRIAPPDDPAAPYISKCERLTGGGGTLCAIAGADFTDEIPDMPVTEQTLEVQIAVFPATAIFPDPITGEPVCPQVEYAANGLPMPVQSVCGLDEDPFACPKVPAVGGRAYYHPGDEKTVVDLGCTDLGQLTDPTCANESRIDLIATLNDFDTVTSVDNATADRVTVSVGEPQPIADTFELNPGDSYELLRTTGSSPAWRAVLTDAGFMSTACLEALEDGAQTTTSLRCYRLADIENTAQPKVGVFVKKASLTQILTALGLSAFPDTGGLVIGIALDENFNPLAGVQVACAGCAVQYLNAGRTGVVAGGTSASGVFVSRDAPYGTEFSIPSTIGGPNVGIGGIVEGKVTIVILQDKGSVVGGG